MVLSKKYILAPAVASLLLTVGCYSISIFIFGADLLLSPVLLLLFLIGASGIVIIPLGIFLLVKRRTSFKWLNILIGISLGFYLGVLIQKPIHNWDRESRNLAGIIIDQSLESFKSEYGSYPEKLDELNLAELKKELPSIYPLEKFQYMLKNGVYDLSIPILIMDRWYWNSQMQEFEYQDF